MARDQRRFETDLERYRTRVTGTTTMLVNTQLRESTSFTMHKPFIYAHRLLGAQLGINERDFDDG